MRLGFVGDVMLGRTVDERQRRRPPEYVWGDVLDRLRAMDGLLINLECTLSTRGEPWTETRHPFHFRADPGWAVPALRAAGVDYCSLANNHLMDFHEPALLDTLGTLDAASIARAGAGRDLDEALAPAVFEVEERGATRGRSGGDARGGSADVDGTGDGRLRVACVAFTDNRPEFAAGPDQPGIAHLPDAGPESRATIRDSLAAASEHDPDLLVASLHWGPNMVAEPDEEFRDLCRWLAEAGVDVVHGHSAHVFHGVEVHAGSLLCYDMGDFVDDYRVDRELRNDRSFLFEVRVERGGERGAAGGDSRDAGRGAAGGPAAAGGGARVAELRLLPVEIYDYAVHEAGPEAAEWCRERMRGLSAPFGTAFERDGPELVVPV